MFNLPWIKQEYQNKLAKFDNIFPVPLEEIAKELGYKVKYFVPSSEETKNVSGYVDYRNSIIGINSEDVYKRQRFTLAHEIGHVLNGDAENNGDMDVDYRSNMIDNSKNSKEIKANKVAAELLMPETKFIPLFSALRIDLSIKFGEWYSVSEVFWEMSKFFQVSQEAVEYRAKQLQLI